MGSFDKFISSLERNLGPQGKGKKFEVFFKWFLQNDPQWSRLVDEVWYFEDYPDKWQTADLGTDLVFRDKQGVPCPNIDRSKISSSKLQKLISLINDFNHVLMKKAHIFGYSFRPSRPD